MEKSKVSHRYQIPKTGKMIFISHFVQVYSVFLSGIVLNKVLGGEPSK